MHATQQQYMLKWSQSAAGSDVAGQPRVPLFLVLAQLSPLQEVHLVQVLVTALLVGLQLVLHL